jgi:hypothetical protein
VATPFAEVTVWPTSSRHDESVEGSVRFGTSRPGSGVQAMPEVRLGLVDRGEHGCEL